MAEDMDFWRTPVNMAMPFRVAQKVNFFRIRVSNKMSPCSVKFVGIWIAIPRVSSHLVPEL
jgi:hypothetical protein